MEKDQEIQNQIAGNCCKVCGESDTKLNPYDAGFICSDCYDNHVSAEMKAEGTRHIVYTALTELSIFQYEDFRKLIAEVGILHDSFKLRLHDIITAKPLTKREGLARRIEKLQEHADSIYPYNMDICDPLNQKIGYLKFQLEQLIESDEAIERLEAGLQPLLYEVGE